LNNKVAIIGSGIAGIATSIRLKAKGFDVTVYEKNSFPGGKLSSFKLGEFRFDAGPSLFTMPQYVDELFDISGENPKDHFKYKRKKIACKYFWEDESIFNAYSDKEKFYDECENKFNVERKQIKKYLDKAKKKFDLTRNIFLEKSLHKINSFLNYETVKALFNLNIYQINKNLNEVNQKEIEEKHLVQLFNRYATYNGSSPYKTPGMMTLIQHLESHYGTYIPLKGMNDISNSLYRLAERKGVKFEFESEVEKIEIQNNQATGIIVNNKLKRFDKIVSNSDVYSTYKYLLKEKLNHNSLKQERSSSAIIFYWGIKKIYKQLDLHNIFFSDNYEKEFKYIFNENKIIDDPTIYVNITSKDVPNDSPESCENWFVMVNSPFNTGQDWEKIKKTLRSNIISKLERILKENISSNIVEERIYTPIDLESNTNSHQGSLYGISSNNKFSAFLRHPNFLKKIPNLYFCGGSVHPGGGIPLCLLSAKIVSNLIEK
jgi:phytoene desaturase